MLSILILGIQVYKCSGDCRQSNVLYAVSTDLIDAIRLTYLFITLHFLL